LLTSSNDVAQTRILVDNRVNSRIDWMMVRARLHGNFFESDLVGECFIVLIRLIDGNRAKPRNRTDANISISRRRL